MKKQSLRNHFIIGQVSISNTCYSFHDCFRLTKDHRKCCILTLDRAVNQRRTCVNKRKQSRNLSQVAGDMK